MSTKRQLDKLLIINSPEIEIKVCNEISTTMKRMWEFSFAEDGNNRSSGKTDFLHLSWENILKDSFGDFKDLFVEHFSLMVEKESVKSTKTNQIKQIQDIFGSTFKVDMVITHQQKIHTVFLLKAPLTSINKNRYNSAVCNFGEIDRFYGNHENVDIELVFVNFLPLETFTIDNKNNAIKNEKVKYLGLKQDGRGNRPIDKIPKSKEIKDKVHEIHIDYKLNFGVNFSEIKKLAELKNLISEKQVCVSLLPNALSELKLYMKHFLTTNARIFKITNNDCDVGGIAGKEPATANDNQGQELKAQTRKATVG